MGISFGDDRVDLVCLRHAWGKTIMVDSTSIPFTYGMEAELFTKGVAAFIGANRLGAVEPNVAIRRKDVVLLTTDLPVPVEDNLREVLGYELDKYTPFSRDTAIFGFSNLGRTKDGSRVRVLLAAIDKERFNYYLDILSGAGLSPQSVEISSAALARTLPHGKGSGVDAVFYSGADTCELLLARAGKVEYSKALARADLSAEAVLKEYQKALASAVEHGGGEMERVVVCGDEGFSRDLLTYLSEGIGKEAVEVVEIKGLDTAGGGDASSRRVALGCAIRGISGEIPTTDFLSPKVREAPGAPRAAAVAVVLLALTALMWTGELAVRISKEKSALQRIDMEIAGLKGTVAEAEDIRGETMLVEGSLQQMEGFVAGKGAFLQVLGELTDVIPDDSYLTMLKYHDDEIEMLGRSTSAVTLLSLLDASPMFEDVRFSATMTRKNARTAARAGNKAATKDRATEEFRIKATVVRKQ
ncbi:MAG: PilN domain-containing protein [Thermodesulfobacteriota bacterium]